MKNFTKVLLALTVYFSGIVFLQGAEIESPGTPLRKLQRGFLNVALWPIEISNELSKEKKKDTFPPSWVAGVGRGSIFAVGRALVGVYEIATFPIPYPADYEPVVQPEFTWQHLPSSDKK
ncbi:MAG TPA: exosortase system-associated protein, TIGR04073 family [Candidatus Omnitrophota bacterium]|nr:exosortase system-associated protein, TIGR04073 family [Candidatus Omnitrophota bacterium]